MSYDIFYEALREVEAEEEVLAAAGPMCEECGDVGYTLEPDADYGAMPCPCESCWWWTENEDAEWILRQGGA